MSSSGGLPGPEPSVWVVGLDGSENARQALGWSADLAQGRHVRLLVMSAWQYPSLGLLPTVGSAIPAFDEEVGAAIEREIEAIAEEVAASTGVDIETRLELGPAAQVLLDALEGADLAVVGSRGRGGFARLMLGSVSHQLATHARRPTIIVPEASERAGLHRVVVGVDGSENSVAALRWAHGFVPDSVEVVALGVWDELIGAGEHDFDAAVARAEAALGATGRFARVFETGIARERLVDHAADADLLVVGERGHRAFLGGVLGSVTTWVIHHLVCPTAVVPAPDRTADVGQGSATRPG